MRRYYDKGSFIQTDRLFDDWDPDIATGRLKKAIEKQRVPHPQLESDADYRHLLSPETQAGLKERGL